MNAEPYRMFMGKAVAMQEESSTARFQLGRAARCGAMLATVVSLMLAICLIGCSAPAQSSADSSEGVQTQTVRVGTMPTEDILPLWAAEQEGLFEPNDVAVEIVPFDSAQSLSAAITAGQVDMAMTDIMRAVKLCESGTDVVMEWVTLGAAPEQGRFGVQVCTDSPVRSLDDLSGKSVAVAANTVPEYVFDKLCEQAGIDFESIQHIESASLPERYALMVSGSHESAALPGSLLALGEAQGMRTIADDTQGANISQSVMVARADWAAEHEAAIEAVACAWDGASALINTDPDAFRPLLVEKANLNSAIADSYPVSSYPMAFVEAEGSTALELARVPQELVEPVLAWMKQKGYTEASVTYDEETGAFAFA